MAVSLKTIAFICFGVTCLSATSSDFAELQTEEELQKLVDEVIYGKEVSSHNNEEEQDLTIHSDEKEAYSIGDEVMPIDHELEADTQDKIASITQENQAAQETITTENLFDTEFNNLQDQSDLDMQLPMLSDLDNASIETQVEPENYSEQAMQAQELAEPITNDRENDLYTRQDEQQSDFSQESLLGGEKEEPSLSLFTKGMVAAAVAQGTEACRKLKLKAIDPVSSQYKTVQKKWSAQSDTNKIFIVAGVVFVAGVAYTVIKEADLYMKRKQLVAQVRNDVCFLVKNQTQAIDDIAYMQLMYKELQQKINQPKTVYKTVTCVHEKAISINDTITVYVQQSADLLEFWMIDDCGIEYFLMSL